MKIGIGMVVPDIATLPGPSRPGGNPGPPPPPVGYFVLLEDGSKVLMQDDTSKVLTQIQ